MTANGSNVTIRLLTLLTNKASFRVFRQRRKINVDVKILKSRKQNSRVIHEQRVGKYHQLFIWGIMLATMLIEKFIMIRSMLEAVLMMDSMSSSFNGLLADIV